MTIFGTHYKREKEKRGEERECERKWKFHKY